MDDAYNDKLDGKIPEQFWQRKQAEWQLDESAISGQISRMKEGKGADRLLDVRRIL